MYRIWYWAEVDRESDGRFIASIPDLEGLSAWGANEKDAVAHVSKLAAEHVRTLVASGEPVPRARPAAELPRTHDVNRIGRAMISVHVGTGGGQAGAVRAFGGVDDVP
jgi:predicted RNase H-like HicB family nuclease